MLSHTYVWNGILPMEKHLSKQNWFFQTSSSYRSKQIELWREKQFNTFRKNPSFKNDLLKFNFHKVPGKNSNGPLLLTKKRMTLSITSIQIDYLKNSMSLNYLSNPHDNIKTMSASPFLMFKKNHSPLIP